MIIKREMQKIYFPILMVMLIFSLNGQSAYENLIFEGAGIRGLAYSGAIKGLEENNVLDGINRVGGTSAGAITAMMLAIGYDAEEIYTLISNTEFQKFNKGGFGVIGGLRRMKLRYGWYKHDKFEKWLNKIIETKTRDSEITFLELKQDGFKELYVTGTSLSKQEMVVFSAETYPHMRIKDAVKVSMSIPLYFGATFIDSSGRLYDKQEPEIKLDIVVDGGIVGNYPIQIFDTIKHDSTGKEFRLINKGTLGIRMDSEEQIVHDKQGLGLVDQEISDFRSYIDAFYVMVLENLNRNNLMDSDWERTISVSSVGIGPRIKKLSDEEKTRLIESGEVAVREFFNSQNTSLLN